MKKQHNVNVISLPVLISLIALASISVASSIETPLSGIVPNNGFSHQGITITLTNAELLVSEFKQIQNPKIPYSLGFVAESFTPTQKVDNRLKSKLQDLLQGKTTFFSNSLLTNETYGFVMILGRVTPEKLQTLSNHGVKLLGYHSGHSYKAKIPSDAIVELEKLDFIKWVGYSTSKQKLSTVLFDIINRTDKILPIYVSLFDDEIFNDTTAAPGKFGKILEERSVKIISYDADLKSYYALATPQVIQKISDLDFVLFIEEERSGTVAHDWSTPSVGADYLRGGTYDGSGD